MLSSDLLRRRAVELDPAGVALAHAVREIGLDAPRGEDRPVDVDDDERHALPRGAVQLLVRVQQPLRRRRRERADAGPRRRDDVPEHRVLALEVRELDVVASRDELREPLDDDRLRRDRVAADRPDAREHHRVRGGLVGRQHHAPVRQRPGSRGHLLHRDRVPDRAHDLADAAALAVEVVDRPSRRPSARSRPPGRRARTGRRRCTRR